MYIDGNHTLHVELSLPDSIDVDGYMTGDGEENGLADTIYIQIALRRDTSVVNPHSYYIPIHTDGGQDFFSREYIEEHNIQRISIVDEEGRDVYGIDLEAK